MKLNLTIISILAIGMANIAQAVPAALQPLQEELNDLTASNLQNSSRFARGTSIGIQNQAESPRYRASEGNIPYLMHDETDFQSETYQPFEYYGRLSKEAIEEAYFSGPTLQVRSETVLNSSAGSWLQMLMFQEPTIAEAAKSLINISNDKVAEQQRDRSNEINFNASRSHIPNAVLDSYEQCVATQSITLMPGDVDGAKEYCEEQASLIGFLSARGAAAGSCELSSLVMWGSLSSEVANRMRSQFGDDELCVATPTSTSLGRYVTFDFRSVPPEFSSRQLWYQIFEQSLIDLKDVLQKVYQDRGAYQLSTAELGLISISSDLKATQELVDAVYRGIDPIRELPDLVKYWASKKADEFLDRTCSEARIAVEESASSQATARERKRWSDRVAAVCGPRDEIKKQMTEVTKNEEVFKRILAEGERAAAEASRSAVTQTQNNKDRGRDTSQGLWTMDGGIPADIAEDSSL